MLREVRLNWMIKQETRNAKAIEIYGHILILFQHLFKFLNLNVYIFQILFLYNTYLDMFYENKV